MAELVRVTRASDNTWIITDVDTAQTMKDAGELVEPGATTDRMTPQTVWGSDYEPDTSLSGNM